MGPVLCMEPYIGESLAGLGGRGGLGLLPPKAGLTGARAGRPQEATGTPAWPHVSSYRPGLSGAQDVSLDKDPPLNKETR